tara:strand:- start:738 stop:1091 length:354 start_codon:yes stop_codon:yes gene_type:complete
MSPHGRGQKLQTLLEDTGEFNPPGFHNCPIWFLDICIDFLSYVCQNLDTHVYLDKYGVEVTMRDQTPMELWINYYTLEEYQSNAYYYDTNGTVTGAIGKSMINWSWVPDWMVPGKRP